MSNEVEGCWKLVRGSDPRALASSGTSGYAKVLLIITGGTICMRPASEEGISMSNLSCAPLEVYLRAQPEMQSPSLPDFDVVEWSSLIDSSDFTHHTWAILASQIQRNYDKYDGFVILHGTDTLSYTASALSFMLENLAKPVVLTGAMLPMSHINTDAKKNVCISLLTAGYSSLTEVVVCFGSRILRGCRVKKTNCGVMDAFDSPNCLPLGNIGIDLTVNPDALLRPQETMARKGLTVQSRMAADSVYVFRITPAFSPQLIRQVSCIDRRPLGIILQLFGTGTAPMANSSFVRGIKFAIDGGLTVVAVTQCNAGSCSLRTYANGEMLYNLGVIEGKDLTTEAAFAKLAYLFGKGYSGQALRELMMTSIRGELTDNLQRVTGQGGLRRIRTISFERAETERTASEVGSPRESKDCCEDNDGRSPVKEDEE